MKRITALLCVFILAFSLCGCTLEHRMAKERTKSADFSDLDYQTENYNNSFSLYDSFCASEDIYVYNKTGNVNTYLYAFYKGEELLLAGDNELGNKSFGYTNIISGDSVYFDALSSDYNDYATYICRYSFKNKSFEPVFSEENIEKWAVADGKIVYLTYYDESDSFYSLYYYDIEAKKANFICKEVEEFGITDEKIRYITYDGNEYTVYQYDFASDKSEKLQSFEGYSIKEYVRYNFTKDSVIMLPDTKNQYSEASEYSIVDLKSGKVQTHTIPYGVNTFTAGEDYAYVMCQPDINTEYKLEDYGLFSDNAYDIYRLELKSGKYELLDIASNDYTSLFVANDNEIFTLNSKEKIGGFVTEVYRYNSDGDSGEKLFEYKY